MSRQRSDAPGYGGLPQRTRRRRAAGTRHRPPRVQSRPVKAWHLVVSPSGATTRSVVERFGKVLGEPTQTASIGPGTSLSDYDQRSGHSRFRADEHSLELDDGADEGSGQVLNQIRVQQHTDALTVTITSDPTGLFPVYYAAVGPVFAASSHLHALAAALDLPLDPVGELSYFGLCYVVGQRTLYAGASHLRPNARLHYDGTVRVEHRTDVEPLYQDLPLTTSRADAANEVWRRLRTACRRVGENASGPVGVFLSGGLDSRMVMAGLAAEGVPMVAATHGQAHLQEINVAQRVARLAGAPLTVCELGPLPLLGSETELTDLFHKADHLLFPWWRHSARALVDAGAAMAATGYLFDATLGGHYHDAGSKSERVKRRLRTAVRGPSPAEAEAMADPHYIEDFVGRVLGSIRATLAYRGSLLAADSPLHTTGLLDAVEADIRTELAHYRATGTTSPAQLKERYLGENRGRKYAFSQELVARQMIGIATPTADIDLMALLSSLPPSWLLDHHLYYEVMRTHARPYASIPGSNSPLPITAPTAILEVTRMARNRFDRLAMRTSLKSRGRRRISSFGSADYEYLARRPGADEGIRAIVTRGGASNYDPQGAERWLDEVASYERFSFNMVPMTSLATLRLASAPKLGSLATSA